MANAPYQRTPNKGDFAYAGVDLVHPVDRMPQGRAPYMLNVSPNITKSALQARPGCAKIDQIDPGKSPIHSITRVNDLVPEAARSFARFIGVSDRLYSGQSTGSFVLLDSGYSGNPLAFVPYRPAQSPESWLYTYDSNQQRKYKTDGTTKRQIGIVAPNKPPVANLGVPLYTPIIDADTSASGWTVSGDAGAVATTARVTAGTTIAEILYDTGASGWCLIQPVNSAVNYSWLGLGARLNLSGTEDITVEQVFPSFSAVSVQAVAYDNPAAATGPCTIVLTIQVQGIARNALLQIGASTNYYRVLSVTAGPDQNYSIRLNSGSNTINPGDTVTPVPAFRAYTALTHASGDAITGVYLSSAFTFSTGIGLISKSQAVDLSRIGTTRLTDSDYLHVSLWCDTPTNLVEIHVKLDVDPTTNNFTRNFYYYVARQGDFTELAAGVTPYLQSQLDAAGNLIADSLTSIEEETGSGQSPYPVAVGPAFSVPSAEQLAAGAGVWFELTLKLDQLTRVGSDPTGDLGSIKAIGFTLIGTASFNFQFGGMWAGGGYGPDADYNSYGNQGTPIQYRYRYRATETGALSAVSPATRNGDLPRRQAVVLSIPGSSDPQVDVIDIERFGGTLSGWHRIATVNNASGNVPYTDTITEAQAEGGQALELAQYQPWPVTDAPHTGTCNIVGTRVVQTGGDPFNVAWIRGVEIIVNNQTYTLYAPPDSPTQLQTAENIGVLNGVTFLIPEATIPGVPLPFAWHSKTTNRVLACGDKFNPGWVYFSNSDNPDTASDAGYVEVTSPSEPLLGGGHFEGADYVFTTQSAYRLDPSGGVNPFSVFKLSLTYGLAGSWSFTVNAPFIFLVSTDGSINNYNPAGVSQRISDDLYPLFPHESEPGQIYNPLPQLSGVFSAIFPPDFNRSQTMRLTFVNNQLFFDYQDTHGVFNTFCLDMTSRGWVPYFYNPQVACRYQEEGIQNPATLLGTYDGQLLQVSNATADEGNDIECIVVTPSDTGGDVRAIKAYGDVMLDFAGTVEVAGYYDDYTVPALTLNPAASPGGARGQILLNVGADNPTWHQSIGLVVVWFAKNNVLLYEWQPSAIAKPERTALRPTDWTDCGYAGLKYIRGLRIHANTFGADRTILVGADGAAGPTIVVNHATELIKPYTFPMPIQAHLVRLYPQDAGSPAGTPFQDLWSLWEPLTSDWEYDQIPESTPFWIAHPTSFGFKGYLHMRDCQFAYAGQGQFTIAMDTGETVTIPLPLTPVGVLEIKQYFSLPPLKGKLATVSAQGIPSDPMNPASAPTNLQVFVQDIEFRVKEWGSTGPYAVVRLVGDGSAAKAQL